MARIQTYDNDLNVTLDDKVIGTDAVDNSTKNFTVGDILALGTAGTEYTAGTGISITDGVINCTVVDTNTTYTADETTLERNGTVFSVMDGGINEYKLADRSVYTNHLNNNIIVEANLDIRSADGVAGQYLASNGDGVFEWVTPPSATLPEYGLNVVGLGGNVEFYLMKDGFASSIVTLRAGSNITLSEQGGTGFTIDAADTNDIDYISSVSLSGTNLVFGATGNAFSGTVSLASLLDNTDAQTLSINGSDLTISNGNTITLPAQSSTGPERLLLRSVERYTLNAGDNSDMVFESIGANFSDGSWQINNSGTFTYHGNGFECNASCIARVAVGAFVSAASNNETLTLELWENNGGTLTQLGQAEFQLGNAGNHAISFFSVFPLRSGSLYYFRAGAAQTGQLIEMYRSTLIEIEVLE